MLRLRNHFTSWPSGLLIASLAMAIGCTPPQFTLPPEPAAGAAAPTQSRMIQLPRSEVFPKVLGVLLDLGYQVRSANAELGLVNISRTWFDETTASRPELSMEATLLFEDGGKGATLVRMLPTGRWRQLNVSAHGTTTASQALPSIAPEQTLHLLDQLAQRLDQPSAH